MQQYLDLLKKIKEEGIDSEDRTGVGTRSIFGHQMRFDLQKGFPLVTTKKVYWKGVVYELLWFLRGDTNIKYLTDHNVNIWNDWTDENGDLGPVYGAVWRYAPSHNIDAPDMKMVEICQDQYANFKEPEIVWYNKIECDLNSEDIWAIGVVKTSPNRIYKVQTKTGFVGEISRPNWRRLKSLNKFDGYAKTIFGIGFIGNKTKHNNKVYELWYNMMSRCYNKKHPCYKMYGGKGVTVSPIWHSFERFAKTISTVPMYPYWVNGNLQYELDKDYFGSNVYSPNTCVFIPKKMNVYLNGTVIEYNNTIYPSIQNFANRIDMPSTTVNEYIRRGVVKNEIDFSKVKKIEAPSGYLIRPVFYYDQIADVIKNIKNNSESRRHIVCTWNPDLVDKQALPPCHTLFQFYVRNGKLSCQLYQRSCDAFLGLPFNIASYSLLTHMIAKMCDLEVGEFVWTGGDVHIYHNHFDQVDLQLTREPLPLPTLNVKVKRDKIEDYDFDDFELINYQSYDKIPAPIAV